jgi:hypothetical protein
LLPLTQTEAWYLGESLKGETLMAQKLTSYGQMAQDPQLKALIQNLERTCERHISLLSGHVR